MEMQLTPIEKIQNVFLKRDDLFQIYGVCGGKARSAYQIIKNAIDKGYNVFCTAGSRMSPQCEIVSEICQHLGVECHLFMPSGGETSVTKNICKNPLSFIHRTKVGYNTVLLHDAIKFSQENNFYYIPFGMECLENVETTMHQVKNIPTCISRIVIPCGSGMSMISVIKGLQLYKKNIPVLGVVVGKNPTKNFEKYIRNDLFENIDVKYEFAKSTLMYGEKAKCTMIGGIELDPIYEAKCLPFLKDNDLLWIVGHRKSGEKGKILGNDN